jgi:type VI secretion system protein VasI
MSLPPDAPTGHWRVQAAPSAVPGRTDHIISLASQSMVKCRWTDPRPAELRIRCLANVTSVLLETGCYMASGATRSDGDVTVQIDSSETRVARMTAGPDGKSLGIWSGDRAIPFVRTLLGKSALSVRMTPHSDEPVSAVFDLRGIDTAIAPARTACGW